LLILSPAMLLLGSKSNQLLSQLCLIADAHGSDWFRKETLDDSLQPTIDMLLNVTFFIWIGATCPWPSFAHNNVIPIYRLVFLGILILLLRRPPFVMLIHKRIHQIEQFHQAIFVGFFGPIGVSALFYLYVALDWLRNNVTYEGKMRDDAERLSEILMVVIWFLVITSTVSTPSCSLWHEANFF
jgi:sodium/hydrogen antiporter